MAALTEPSENRLKATDKSGSFLIATSSVIYPGALVGLNASGLLIPWDGSAGSRLLGLSKVTDPDGITGDGTLEAPVQLDDVVLEAITLAGGAGQTDVGEGVWFTTDNPDDCTQTRPVDALQAEGWIIRSRSATSVDVALIPARQQLPRSSVSGSYGPATVLFASGAQSSAVTNTTDTTTFSTGSATISGAELVVGDVIRIRGSCFVADNNSTDTLTLRILLGTEVLYTTSATDAADNDTFYFDIQVTVRAVGASGSIMASGVVSDIEVSGSTTLVSIRKAAATENISGDFTILVDADWSVAHADNQVHLEDFVVELHRPVTVDAA